MSFSFSRVGLLAGFVFATQLALVGTVRADLISPDVGACQRLSTGADCTVPETNTSGKCVDTTCSKYYPPTTGGNGTTTTYSCVRCLAGGATGQGTAGQVGACQGCQTAGVSSVAGSSATAGQGKGGAAVASPPAKAKDSGCGCNLSDRSGVALFALGLVPLAYFGLLRRRRSASHR